MYKQNVLEGDVVLRKDETAASQTHKYGCVFKVHNGTDRMVWSTDMKYKLLGEEKVQSNNYPTHKKTDHGGPTVEEQTFDDELGCIEAEENDNKL
jgi:hypothetical protein